MQASKQLHKTTCHIMIFLRKFSIQNFNHFIKAMVEMTTKIEEVAF